MYVCILYMETSTGENFLCFEWKIAICGKTFAVAFL